MMWEVSVSGDSHFQKLKVAQEKKKSKKKQNKNHSSHTILAAMDTPQYRWRLL